MATETIFLNPLSVPPVSSYIYEIHNPQALSTKDKMLWLLSRCLCEWDSYRGWGSLLHAAKDESLAVLPDLVLRVTQPVH